jgi:hypothetical protein
MIVVAASTVSEASPSTVSFFDAPVVPVSAFST